MSIVGDNLARATAAAIRAAQLAPFVHCKPEHRDPVRKWLREDGSEAALRVLAELEERWAAL